MVVYNVFQSAFTPLADALAITLIRDPAREYARIRLLSSLSYGFVVLLVGFLYTQTGLPARAASCGPRRAWSSPPACCSSTNRRTAKVVIEHGRGGSARVALAVQPRLPAVLLAVGLVFFGILGSYTFLNLRMVELGGAPSALGIAAGFAAFAEIPGSSLAPRIARRIGLRGLFVGSALLYSAVILSWAFMETPEQLIASRFLSGPAFAGLAIAGVLTINVLLPLNLQATGQGLYQTIAFGIGGVLANATGGVIYQGLGPPVLFAVHGGRWVRRVAARVARPAAHRRDARAGVRGTARAGAVGGLIAPTITAQTGQEGRCGSGAGGSARRTTGGSPTSRARWRSTGRSRSMTSSARSPTSAASDGRAC